MQKWSTCASFLLIQCLMTQKWFDSLFQMAVWRQALILVWCIMNCVESSPLRQRNNFNDFFDLTTSTRTRVQQLQKNYVSTVLSSLFMTVRISESDSLTLWNSFWLFETLMLTSTEGATIEKCEFRRQTPAVTGTAFTFYRLLQLAQPDGVCLKNLFIKSLLLFVILLLFPKAHSESFLRISVVILIRLRPKVCTCRMLNFYITRNCVEFPF